MEDALEAAALGAEADRAEALVAAISPDGERAVVLTRMPTGHELHRFCVKTDDGWELDEDEPPSTAGTSWSDSGIWHVSGLVPHGIKAVKLRFGGEDHEIAVEDRRYIAAWWNVQESTREPELVAYIWRDGLETEILA
jgi:hypothetical protein